jgi:hypothetical protein
MSTTHERPPSDRRGPIIDPDYDYGSVTDKISSIVLARGTHLGWWLGFGASFMLMMVLLWSVVVLFAYGTGVWGLNVPVGWGFAIINFVWWIGIGHAGTLISAILLVLRQEWRTSSPSLARCFTRSCTWGAPVTFITWFPTPARWAYGRSSAVR